MLYSSIKKGGYTRYKTLFNNRYQLIVFSILSRNYRVILWRYIRPQIVISLILFIFRRKVYIYKSTIQIYFNIELYRYIKQLVLMVKRAASINLLLFYRLNIIYNKLVTIGKLELFSKIIGSSAIIRVIQSLETKLIKEDIFIDTISTLDSTLVLYNSTKLLKFSLPIINILYT